MHKNVSFPLIKAWFHCIFQWSWKWGRFICRRIFRGPCKCPRENFICLHAMSYFAYFAGFHPQLELRLPSPDAKDRRMWETNWDTHCWEYVETEGHWQGNKATCCTMLHKGDQSLCCQPGSSHKLYICITSCSKFRNQIDSPNIFTISIKPSHIINTGNAKNSIVHWILENSKNRWTKTLTLNCPSFWLPNKTFCSQLKERFSNCLGRLISRKDVLTHGKSHFYLPLHAVLIFCFQTG